MLRYSNISFSWKDVSEHDILFFMIFFKNIFFVYISVHFKKELSGFV